MIDRFKKTLKSGLHRLGLLNPAQRLYFNLRTASPSVLLREFQHSRNKAPGRAPLPPPSLIYDVIACRWGAVFLDSGRTIVEDMAEILDKNHLSLSSFESILDFGCGCGRLIRHLPERTKASLYGSDYNPRLIRWCQDYLTFAQFSTNELAPPLSFESGSFDLIYARSVFTHLPLDLTLEWIRELHAKLRRGGCLYFTMHGRPLAHGLSADQRAQMERAELVITYSRQAGENLCSTYATDVFVKEKLLQGFTLVDFVEGRNREHLRQDVYLLRKG